MTSGKQAKPLCVITGVGRSGTTFLVELMTALGLDTGFADDEKRKAYFHVEAKAGLEINPMREPDPPYIVKDPRICDYIDELVSCGRFDIEHVFVPIRRLEEVAASRAIQTECNSTAGGLWKTKHSYLQALPLAETFYRLMDHMAFHDLSFTTLSFPRLALDAEYTYRRLGHLVIDIDFATFQSSFQAGPRLKNAGVRASGPNGSGSSLWRSVPPAASGSRYFFSKSGTVFAA